MDIALVLKLAKHGLEQFFGGPSSEPADFFESTVDKITSSVENDAISLSSFEGGAPLSIDELCYELVSRHSYGVSFGQHFSNS